MTELANTYVFTWIAALFGSLWESTAGQIFLLTFLAYSASYMLYSGYISWFAGGYGGLLLSQVGFTAIDFLSLVPATILLMIESIWNYIKSISKFIIYGLVVPYLLGLAIYTSVQSWPTHDLANSQTLFMIGGLIWLVAAYMMFRKLGTKNKIVFIVLVVLASLGIIMLIIFAPHQVNTPASQAPVTNTSSSGFQLLWEIFAISLLISVVAIPPSIGISLAEYATQAKLLSRLTKIVLKQSILVPGMKPVQVVEIEKKLALFERVIAIFQPKVKVEPRTYDYEGDANLPVYLIASFNKVTALYISPEIVQSKRGKMVLLANDLIYSMEVEGRKIRAK
jgi:hypothetical protein